jgi:hypothetical protein
MSTENAPTSAPLELLVGPDAEDAEEFRPMCCGEVMNSSVCCRCRKDRVSDWKYFTLMRQIRLRCLRAARLIELRAPELIVRGEIAEIAASMCRGW